MTASAPRGRSAMLADQSSTPMTLSGWAVFASVMLIIAGAFNIIHGITALNHSEYLTSQLMYSNLDMLGWALIIWGGLQVLAGLLAFGIDSVAGPVIGVVLCAAAAVLWFFMIFAAPFAALIAIIVNVAVIYGLTAGRAADRAH